MQTLSTPRRKWERSHLHSNSQSIHEYPSYSLDFAASRRPSSTFAGRLRVISRIEIGDRSPNCLRPPVARPTGVLTTPSRLTAVNEQKECFNQVGGDRGVRDWLIARIVDIIIQRAGPFARGIRAATGCCPHVLES